MSIKLRKQSSSSVAIPGSTHVQFFVDDNGLPQLKDDTGALTPVAPADYATLVEIVAAPSTETNKAKIYAKDVAGITETFILDDQGNEIQVTDNGAIAGIGSGTPTGPAGGDLGGTYPNPLVEAINGVTVSGVPTSGQVITATSGSAASWQTLSVAVGNITGMGSGMATFLATPNSANLQATVTDETGSGSLVFATSPVLVTPALGTPSALVLTNATGRASSSQTADQIATSGTPVSISNTAPTSGQVLTASSATAAAWSAPTIAVGSITGLGANVATFLATPSSANLAAALTDETGTGANVFATSPVLVTPNLGTPSVAVLTNATGLPVSTGISGLGANIATFLATPSSANLAAALTDETGTGASVFATSPTLVTPNLGTPSTLVLTNATGRASSSQTADQIATSGTAVSISATAPTTGQVLTATSATAANWQAPAGGSPTGSAGGDLGGTYPNPTVVSFQSATTTVNVGAATAPTAGQVLTATSSTAATWQSPTGGDASGLATTGASVNVSLANPPTTGQVLTATSATTATWQTPSGGSGLTVDPVFKITGFTAVAGNSYFLESEAPTLIRLPSSPADGDQIEIAALAALDADALIILDTESTTTSIFTPTRSAPLAFFGGGSFHITLTAVTLDIFGAPMWMAETDEVASRFNPDVYNTNSTADGASTTTTLVDPFGGFVTVINQPRAFDVSVPVASTSMSASTTFTDGAATFQSNGVTAADYLRVTTGPNIGIYSIASVDSETQLTLNVALPNASASDSYEIITLIAAFLVTFDSGPNAGLTRLAAMVNDTTLTLSPALPGAPGAGDSYTVRVVTQPANKLVVSDADGFLNTLICDDNSVIGRTAGGSITSIPISSLALPVAPGYQSTNFTAVSNTAYALLVNGGDITVTLPVAPADGDKVELYSVAYVPGALVSVDTGGATFTVPSGNIGGADPAVFEANGLQVGWVWDSANTRWRTYGESVSVYFAGFTGLVQPTENTILATGENGHINPRSLLELDGLMVRDESVHTTSFEAQPNYRYYVSSYDNVVVTLSTDFADTDRIEIYGAGDGDGTTIIDSQGIYIAYGSGGTSDPKQFPGHGLHLALRYNAQDGSWENASDEVATRFNSDALYAGTATGGTTTNLEDTGATFTSLSGIAYVWFTSGANVGVVRAVTAVVDNDNLTLSPALASAPTAGDTYQLFAGIPKNRVVRTDNTGSVVTARMNLVAVPTQDTSYDPVAWDLVPVDVTSNDVEINLPPSSTLQNGDQIAVKVIGAATNSCNINPDNTDTIDGVTGAAALVLSTASEWAVLMYTSGGAWLQIS